MTWQGLLQGAQNSTRTGLLDFKTADWKSPSPTDLKLGLLGFIFTTAVSRRQHHCAAAMPLHYGDDKSLAVRSF
jgi:hypothetical protein